MVDPITDPDGKRKTKQAVEALRALHTVWSTLNHSKNAWELKTRG